MSTNQQIIKAVKQSLGNQTPNYKHHCPKCEMEQSLKLNFKKDTATCSVCTEVLEIDNVIYLSIYKQLKDLLGGSLLIN